MVDLKTERQKWMEKRQRRVVALFRELKETSNGSNTAIITHMVAVLSKEPDMTITEIGIRYILKKENLI